MARLDRIILKGYKSIKEVDLELTNLNILIGANGAGKSNFISFFRLLNSVIENNLASYVTKNGRANSFFYFGMKNTEKIVADLYFDTNLYQVEFGSTNDNYIYFINESAKHRRLNKKDSIWIQDFKYSGHEISYLLNIPKIAIPPQYAIDALKSWIVYHFHDTGSTAAVKRSCNINDNRRLRFDGSNLAAYLYLLQEKYKDNYKKIVETIKLVAPFFEDFKLQPNPLNDELINIEWKEKGSDEYFNANHLSDGTLRFICLVTVLLQPKLPDTIIIDEPELGLHPYAINVLASLIKKVGINKQVIISTQSVPLISEFNPEDIITVDRKGTETEFKRHSIEELKDWLEDYSLGELWEKNILGGRP